MLSWCYWILINFYGNCIQAKLTGEHVEKLRGMACQCKAKEGVTEDDVHRMIAFAFPNTPSGKCLHACVQETIGIVSINSGI